MFHKLLGEASADLERVTPQSRESSHIEAIRNAHRCSRSETPSCAVKLESASKTRLSRESLAQVADDDFRKQLELSVPLHKTEAWKYEFKMSSFTTTILNVLFAESEQKGKTRHFRTHIGLGSDGSIADNLSLDLKFNPWDTAITFRPEWHSMNKTAPVRILEHRAE